MKFTKDMVKELGCYVYRLIDPRNGNTFYVGKGKSNRIFEHVEYAIKEKDDENFKYDTIREIKKAGLEVIHIIHRYNLSENEALAVEAALIDCYPGLTNLQRGHNADYGVINTKTLINTLSKETYDDNSSDKYVLIKVKEEFLEQRKKDLNIDENNFEEILYQTVRSAWTMKLDNAKKYPYVLGVINGVVKGVYKVNTWQKHQFIENRIEFIGEKANEDMCKKYLDKRIPERFMKKGASSPFFYSDGDTKKS